MTIQYGLDNESYHKHESISKSGLDLINISPAHFKKSERKDSPEFALGTLIHCAVLEPDELLNRYYTTSEKIDLRTKAGKEKQAEHAEKAAGKIIISLDNLAISLRIRDEIQNHRIAKYLFSGGQSEVSVFSKLDDVSVRCRPDYLNGSVCIDLKSTTNAKIEFPYSVRKYRYHVQDAFYRDVLQSEGVDLTHFLFVAIEKTEPFGIMIYELEQEYIIAGREAYQSNLDTYKRCLDSGEWPGYAEEITTLKWNN